VAKQAKRKPGKTASIVVVEFPYYEDFYVERVPRPIGVVPAEDEPDDDGKRQTSTKRDLTHR